MRLETRRSECVCGHLWTNHRVGGESGELECVAVDKERMSNLCPCERYTEGKTR